MTEEEQIDLANTIGAISRRMDNLFVLYPSPSPFSYLCRLFSLLTPTDSNAPLDIQWESIKHLFIDLR